MKKFIKIIFALSCLAISMSGCGKEAMQYNESQIKECFLAEIQYSTGNAGSEYEKDDVVLTEDLAKDAIKSWAELKDLCGTYLGESDDCEISISNGEITLTQELKGSNRNAIATATFEKDPSNDDKMTMTSLSYEAVYSLGEKLGQAGMNTLLGMGTVFAVLIFISLIISCFRFIPIIIEASEKRKAKKNEIVVQPEASDKDAVSGTEETTQDNMELIAVISAAIAASEQTSTDQFVVRSIRRR